MNQVEISRLTTNSETESLTEKQSDLCTHRLHLEPTLHIKVVYTSMNAKEL